MIITEICLAPFPKVNHIKGTSQKVEKQFTQQKFIYSECFIFLFYLPKQYRRVLDPHPGNQKRKRNEKDYRKYQQENKQGSIDGENKTSSIIPVVK